MHEAEIMETRIKYILADLFRNGWVVKSISIDSKRAEREDNTNDYHYYDTADTAADALTNWHEVFEKCSNFKELWIIIIAVNLRVF